MDDDTQQALVLMLFSTIAKANCYQRLLKEQGGVFADNDDTTDIPIKYRD